ncbi:MAG: MBOAT family protein [Campylobacter sp.]|nr:MBOAT family protein [Campylobacter sp.]
MSLFSANFVLLFMLFLTLYRVTLGIKWLNLLILFGFNCLVLYSFSPVFLMINLCFGLSVFVFGRLINLLKSRFLLILGLFLVVINLCFFKYYDFLKVNFISVFEFLEFNGLSSEILFPIGISFYSFAGITYLVSSYRDKIKPNLFKTLIYFSFFATLISGPIFRSKAFFEALENRAFSLKISEKQKSFMVLIFALISLAIIKKLLLANTLNNAIMPLFSSSADYQVGELILGLLGYSFLLYFDFSGYVNLVQAFGLLIGIKLPENFNKPFMAKNLKEFWGRWHISLSTFIKDYIYIPLGGNRCGILVQNFNVIIAFFISGIWHGNTLSFAFWGLMHAFGVVFLNLTKRFDILKFDYLKIVATFLFVSFAWVFFASKSTGGSFLYLHFMLTKPLEFNICELFWLVAILLFLYIYPKINALLILQKFYHKIPVILYPFVFAVFLVGIYILMPSGMPNFIYQDF